MENIIEFVSMSIEETQEFAMQFSKNLKRGDVILLNGDLGAGKTAFTGGLVSALGNVNCVSSPTFTIVNEYLNGDIPLYHFDLYRLNDEDELYDIGIEEYLDSNGICIFEWPGLVEEMVDHYYNVEIVKDISISEDYRKIIITKKGTE